MRLANIGQSIGWAIVSAAGTFPIRAGNLRRGGRVHHRTSCGQVRASGRWSVDREVRLPLPGNDHRGMLTEEEIRGTLEDRAPCWYLDGRPWRKSRRCGPLSIGVAEWSPSFSQIRKKNKIDQNRDGYINYSFWTYEWVYDPNDDPGYRWVGKCTDGPDGSATREPFDY